MSGWEYVREKYVQGEMLGFPTDRHEASRGISATAELYLSCFFLSRPEALIFFLFT